MSELGKIILERTDPYSRVNLVDIWRSTFATYGYTKGQIVAHAGRMGLICWN